MTEGAGVMLMVQLTMNGISSLPISVTVKPSDGTATGILKFRIFLTKMHGLCNVYYY